MISKNDGHGNLTFCIYIPWDLVLVIGGSRTKKIFFSIYMKDLLIGKQRLFKEPQNFTPFRSYNIAKSEK